MRCADSDAGEIPGNWRGEIEVVGVGQAHGRERVRADEHDLDA